MTAFMAIAKLSRLVVEKPWGRVGIDSRFGADPARRVGEIWFESPPAPSPAARPLSVMAKYLFTEERLSVQVHPDDATARARGHASGKDECWLVLDVADQAEIGIGTIRTLSPADAIAAAADGSIVDLIDWHRPERGDFIYNRAGTIHALGPGLTVLEIQQAIDLTYRLFDYGRPRPLHLAEAADVVRPVSHNHPLDTNVSTECRLLVDGPAFGVAWCVDEPPELPPSLVEALLLPLDSPVSGIEPGECALVDRATATGLRGKGAFVLAWSTTQG
jgi:mannose-6-phosphate isomerase